MRYRVTRSPEDMRRIVDLELVVWGLKPIDVVPHTILSLSAHNGGSLIISEDENQLLTGFCVSFPARRDGMWMLWSHITGVHPAYQGCGIGATLKSYQREWAAANGYEFIGWTFDPLQARNANFNLNVLGAKAVCYHENFYGQMDDSINAHPLPSDRLEARWETSEGPAADIIPPIFFLVEDADGSPQNHLLPSDNAGHKTIGIRIAASQAPNLATWQQAIREGFQSAFEAGYTAIRLNTDAVGQYYVLTR